jgi:hypothetical protein
VEMMMPAKAASNEKNPSFCRASDKDMMMPAKAGVEAVRCLVGEFDGLTSEKCGKPRAALSVATSDLLLNVADHVLGSRVTEKSLADLEAVSGSTHSTVTPASSASLAFSPRNSVSSSVPSTPKTFRLASFQSLRNDSP